MITPLCGRRLKLLGFYVKEGSAVAAAEDVFIRQDTAKHWLVLASHTLAGVRRWRQVHYEPSVHQ